MKYAIAGGKSSQVPVVRISFSVTAISLLVFTWITNSDALESAILSKSLSAEFPMRDMAFMGIFFLVVIVMGLIQTAGAGDEKRKGGI